MMNETTNNYPATIKYTMIALRIAIGWHFLYEGLIKLFSSTWSAKGFLLSSQGFLADIYHKIAIDQNLLPLSESIIISCLIIVGLLLLLGIFSRVAAWIGIGLLLLFYFSHPAWPGMDYGIAYGNHFIIDKLLIEAMTLFLLAQCPTDDWFGCKRIICKTK